MGARRAGELHQMVMTGIGQIFEWYRDDLIEDDDEVVSGTVMSAVMSAVMSTVSTVMSPSNEYSDEYN